MKFDYKRYPRQPIPGAHEGFVLQPKIPITIYGPTGELSFDALVDTGSDQTIFPRFNADHIGAKLHEHNSAHTTGISSAGSKTFYAEGIELLLQLDGEKYKWPAPIWFSESDDFPPLLGRKGFLEFFTATFDGLQNVLTLEPNKNFSGKELDIWQK